MGWCPCGTVWGMVRSVSGSALMCFDNFVCDWWAPLNPSCRSGAEVTEIKVTIQRIGASRAVISLILFLPGDGVMCVTITYFVPSLTLCVYLFVCLLACVPPGPFRQRTQLSMRMMCTGASRSSQSEYATKKTKQVCFAFLRKIVHVFKLNYLQTSPLHSPTLTFHWTLKLNPDLRLNMADRFSIKVWLFNTTETKWHQILFSVASLPRWSERNL